MTNLATYHSANLPELMKVIRQNGIGMDDYLDRFFNAPPQTSNYPPYNLVQLNNHESKLEIALAGFKKNEIKVYTEFGKLYVQGKKEESENVRGLDYTLISHSSDIVSLDLVDHIITDQGEIEQNKLAEFCTV